MKLNIKYITELQKEWEILKQSGNMTKEKICDLCVPFRYQFNLTELEVLKLARNEMPLKEIEKLIKE